MQFTPACRCALAVALTAGPASAQCTGRWLANIPLPGNNAGAYVSALQRLPGSAGVGLVVGGNFHESGVPNAIANIGRYDPTSNTWLRLSGGLDAAADKIDVLPNGDILVIGGFNHAGGNPAEGAARYHASNATWSATGQDGNEAFCLLGLPSGDLLAGHYFEMLVHYSAATDAWTPAGSGLDQVFTLAPLPSGNVLIGGAFNGARNNAGTFQANGIAEYDPVANLLFPLGSGAGRAPADAEFPGVWVARTLSSGDVVVGGSFPTMNDVPVSNIARYSPFTNLWSALGGANGGVPGSVTAIAEGPRGDVIVAYSSIDPSGTGTSTRPHLSIYSAAGNTWTALTEAGGPTGDIWTVTALPNGDIIAGGNFPFLAHWTTRPACPADFDCSGTLTTLDILSFVSAWLSADVHADFNSSGGLEVQDLYDFLNRWFAGC